MIEYFKTEAMFTSKTMRIIFWLSLNSLVIATTFTSCTFDPSDRGLRAGVIKFVGTPITKAHMIDTNLVVGDTIEAFNDSLRLAVIIR
jgi:hypothetical protein